MLLLITDKQNNTFGPSFLNIWPMLRKNAFYDKDTFLLGFKTISFEP